MMATIGDSSGTIRLATWNVERPKPNGWKVPPAQLRRMADVDADIWVLTETHVDHQPTPDHRYRVFSPPFPERRPRHECWAAIWSKWPLTEIDDPPAHRRGTVAAIAHMPAGPLIVYASVIAWANEKAFDDSRPAKAWDVHIAEAQRQADEWSSIRSTHPGVPMIVAGDFNQDRDGSGWYGTPSGRAVVSRGLADAGLVCMTEFDAVAAGQLESQHLVDHICIAEELATSTIVQLHEKSDGNGQRLSDHPTVVIDFELESSGISMPSR